VGKIEKVEDVASSDKLIKLTLILVLLREQFLSEWKRNEKPAGIEGMQALFVVNLAPKKMAGEISEGMLLILATQTKLSSSRQFQKKKSHGVNAG